MSWREKWDAEKWADAVDGAVQDAKTEAALKGRDVLELLQDHRERLAAEGQPAFAELMDKAVAVVELDRSCDNDPGIGLCL